MTDLNNYSSSDGLRIPEDRSVRGIVPAPSETPLSEGPPSGSVASSDGAMAIAMRSNALNPSVQLTNIAVAFPPLADCSKAELRWIREARKKAKEVLETQLHKSAPLSVKKRRLGVWHHPPAQKTDASLQTAKSGSIGGNSSDVVSLLSGNESELSNASMPPMQTPAHEVESENWAVATRGRGRPQSTGEFQLTKRYAVLRDKVAIMEGIAGINDPNLAPKRTRTLVRLERELAPEMEAIRMAPMVDVISRALEETDKIIKVADTSGNLNGCYIQILKKAAITIRSAVTTVSTRSTEDDPWKPREEHLEHLRLELRKAKDENKRLSELLKSVRDDCGLAQRREQTPPAATSPAGSLKTRRRRGVPVRKNLYTDLSSSEDERGTLNRRIISSSQGRPSHISPKSKAISPRKSSPLPLPLLPVADPYGLTHPSERLGTPNRDLDIGRTVPESYTLDTRIDEARQMNIDEQVLATDYDITKRIQFLIEQRARLREGFSDRVTFNDTVEFHSRLPSPARLSHTRNVEEEPLIPSSSDQNAKQVLKPNKRRRRKKTTLARREVIQKHGAETPVWQHQPASFPVEEVLMAAPRHVSFSEVVKRPKTRRAPPPSQPNLTDTSQSDSNRQDTNACVLNNNKRRRNSRNAVVTITCPQGNYAEVMTLAKKRISLNQFDLEEVKMRRAITGAIALEIKGADNNKKADNLTIALRDALKDYENVRVSRPIKLAELRIRDLDDSVTSAQIQLKVAAIGDCRIEDVRVAPPTINTGGMRTFWIKCPLNAAIVLSQRKTIQIEWCRARVDMLPSRPIQCFRCLEGGHVKANCPSVVDRSNCCYRCGVSGHNARGCTAPLRCPICVDYGKPANHRLGSTVCIPSRRKRTGSRTIINRTNGANDTTSVVTSMDTESMATQELPSHTTIEHQSEFVAPTDTQAVTTAVSTLPPELTPLPHRERKKPVIRSDETVHLATAIPVQQQQAPEYETDGMVFAWEESDKRPEKRKSLDKVNTVKETAEKKAVKTDKKRGRIREEDPLPSSDSNGSKGSDL